MKRKKPSRQKQKHNNQCLNNVLIGFAYVYALKLNHAFISNRKAKKSKTYFKCAFSTNL
jgi:hypothetical protein